MSDPPDLQALARRYLDLWQDQLGTMARDPAVSEALARSFSMMTQGLAEAARKARDDGAPPSGGPAPGPNPDGGTHGRPPPATDDRTDQPDAAAASGAKAAGPAPGDAGIGADQLAARVDRLEQRISLLEAALGGLLSRNGPGSPST